MKSLKYILSISLVYVGLNCFSQQPFTAGNIVVCRVGEGVATLNNTAQKVYLDEYTPSGGLVQSILMPVSGSKITLPGADVGGSGFLTLSADGKYLVVPGFNADVGASGTAFLSQRSVAVVDFNGAVQSVTVLPNPSFFLTRSAITDNGTNLWITGSRGLEYATAGASSATDIVSFGSNNSYGVTIADGQLYASTTTNGSPAMAKIGAGLPTTSGQSYIVPPGIPDGIRPYQFSFVDLEPTVPGVDVLYVASQKADGSGGIQKYSLVNEVWTHNGTVGITADYYTGLTVRVAGNQATVFATRLGNNNTSVRGGELVSLVDGSGYNNTLTGMPSVIASVSTSNTMTFRGVALVPQPAPFTAGNIVVYRVGDGSVTLNSTYAKVFLDEYTPSGMLVQSIQMPSSGAQTLTNFGNGYQGGLLNLSSDGKYLVVDGYNEPPGPFADIKEAIGLVDFNGRVSSVTVIPNPNFDVITSAASDNGVNLWFTGGGGVDYTTAGSSSSIRVVNSPSAYTRGINITDGQLYAGITNRKIVIVGNGLPTTPGQTATDLPGISSNIIPFQFAFADLDPNVMGSDVLYVCAQASGTNGGLRKYSLVNGVWEFNGAIGTNANRYAGLAVKVAGSSVTLFATRIGTNSTSIRGGELVSLTDNSGYNGTLSGTPTVLSSIVTRFGLDNVAAFRGIARVPLGCPAVGVFRAIDITPTQVTLSWNGVTNGANYEYIVTSTPDDPVPGTGTITSGESGTVTGLSNGTTYYGHVRTICDGLGGSEWVTVEFETGCQPPAIPLLQINSSITGGVTITWNEVVGAAEYEYFISNDATPPAFGTSVSDTTVDVSGLNAISTYYLHVRSSCGGGAFSNWISKPFTTGCFAPSLHISTIKNDAIASWNSIPNVIKYEYALTNSPAKPLSGTYTTDTTYKINERRNGSANYFHVRSLCSNGNVSEWNTIDFYIEGMQVYPNPVKETLNIRLHGISNANGQITVADGMGRIVKQMKVTGSNIITIDTRTWAAGVYLVRYDDGRQHYVVKVMKQ